MPGPACLAPPLTDELLAAYAVLADDAGGPVGDAMRTLLGCSRAWWDAPESDLQAIGEAVSSSGRRAPVVPLTDDLKAALFDAIPWGHELRAMAVLFDEIPLGPLRDAAHHLLWFANELNLDREPITSDKLA